ncbi:MAG: acyl-CoA dehydrogenase C-terminal domain-containing protein [Parvularculaceae bacterium]
MSKKAIFAMRRRALCHICGRGRGWRLANGSWVALAAQADLATGEGEADFLKAKIATAQFLGERILPRAQSYEAEAIATPCR